MIEHRVKINFEGKLSVEIFLYTDFILQELIGTSRNKVSLSLLPLQRAAGLVFGHTGFTEIFFFS